MGKAFPTCLAYRGEHIFSSLPLQLNRSGREQNFRLSHQVPSAGLHTWREDTQSVASGQQGRLGATGVEPLQAGLPQHYSNRRVSYNHISVISVIKGPHMPRPVHGSAGCGCSGGSSTSMYTQQVHTDSSGQPRLLLYLCTGLLRLCLLNPRWMHGSAPWLHS